jgi:hypothetical protein
VVTDDPTPPLHALADSNRSSPGEGTGGAWWLHFVAMPFLAVGSLGLYPIVQFARWQRTGGKPISRRIAIAVGMTFLYGTVIGWIVVVPWWRRSYASHRTFSATRRRTKQAQRTQRRTLKRRTSSARANLKRKVRTWVFAPRTSVGRFVRYVAVLLALAITMVGTLAGTVIVIVLLTVHFVIFRVLLGVVVGLFLLRLFVVWFRSEKRRVARASRVRVRDLRRGDRSATVLVILCSWAGCLIGTLIAVSVIQQVQSSGQGEFPSNPFVLTFVSLVFGLVALLLLPPFVPGMSLIRAGGIFTYAGLAIGPLLFAPHGCQEVPNGLNFDTGRYAGCRVAIWGLPGTHTTVGLLQWSAWGIVATAALLMVVGSRVGRSFPAARHFLLMGPLAPKRPGRSERTSNRRQPIGPNPG